MLLFYDLYIRHHYVLHGQIFVFEDLGMPVTILGRWSFSGLFPLVPLKAGLGVLPWCLVGEGLLQEGVLDEERLLTFVMWELFKN